MNNKHGLPRDIPAVVKREVRQRDGFGCVRCGSGIYTYEHVDPTFEDAREHNAEAITLLCAGCHDLVTRGHLSKATVNQLMLNPKCHEGGFSFGPLDVGSKWPEIRIGPVNLRRVRVAVRAAGTDVLSIRSPEQPGAPFRISARLTNKAGTETLQIVDNEWRSGLSSWDVELVGQRITFRDAPGEISLVLRANPPDCLILERLNMYERGVHIQADESHLSAGARGRTTFTAYSAEIDGSDVGIEVAADGSGAIGIGGGSVHVGRMVVGPSAAPRPIRPSLGRPTISNPSGTTTSGSPTGPSNPMLGRNQTCGCGSGIKYKRCCGKRPDA